VDDSRRAKKEINCQVKTKNKQKKTIQTKETAGHVVTTKF